MIPFNLMCLMGFDFYLYINMHVYRNDSSNLKYELIVITSWLTHDLDSNQF